MIIKKRPKHRQQEKRETLGISDSLDMNYKQLYLTCLKKLRETWSKTIKIVREH